MNKSPINILQEILIKEGCVPNYSYILDISEFKCEVTCKNLSAIGIGPNKKEAKYNAAVNMLSLLNITIYSKKHKTGNKIQDFKTCQPTHNTNEPNNTNMLPPLNKDTQTFPECNYVGVLQELCMQHRISLPLYEVVQQSGPSHMRTFKVKSSVGSHEMTGIAFCKKAAKQEAAKNILHHLVVSNILPEDTYKKIELYKRKVNINDTKDIKLNVKNTKPVLPIEKPEIEEISEKALPTYELISNNIAMQNSDNGSAVFNNNNNTIKNTQISIYQPKSIKTVNDSKQTLESNFKKLDISKSIVESAITKSSENAQSNNIESNSDDKQYFVTKNDNTNLSLVTYKDEEHKRTIEDDLREFNIEISDFVESNKTMALTDVSKKALSLLENSKKYKSSNVCLTDSHNLFKKLYSDKIPDDLKKRMCIVSKYKLSAIEDLIAIEETYQEVQKTLGVTLNQVNYSNKTADVTIICLRMLSTPVITQIGIGTTENNAKAEAMFAIINTILEYIK
ncbi:uncharacterized protein LOC116853423 [Odontomachus brunneus]|uniref:uncharacterized protein LOC116853423 n=1 Tax=Odontomachus brunneus TaxID=486640 RepID=UPI0013F18B5F|nr:uncharacterized protein LOC116853423 [Odontomachus brunneus]XP_032690400.1 uncharacterized protein LOC116853423 [Odontomachus brunneus]XP_032690405.1 uncharacterized protein LOC116853423 [Odontomachus brunneus]XP_032690413.1 uncharacterized protein LOC116853423 [Odontomachus brunneus]